MAFIGVNIVLFHLFFDVIRDVETLERNQTTTLVCNIAYSRVLR